MGGGDTITLSSLIQDTRLLRLINACNQYHLPVSKSYLIEVTIYYFINVVVHVSFVLCYTYNCKCISSLSLYLILHVHVCV